MFKKRTRLQREAHLEVKMLKKNDIASVGKKKHFGEGKVATPKKNFDERRKWKSIKAKVKEQRFNFAQTGNSFCKKVATHLFNLQKMDFCTRCSAGFQIWTCWRGGCTPNVTEQENDFGHRARGGLSGFKLPHKWKSRPLYINFEPVGTHQSIRLFSLGGPSRVVPTGIGNGSATRRIGLQKLRKL